MHAKDIWDWDDYVSYGTKHECLFVCCARAHWRSGVHCRICVFLRPAHIDVCQFDLVMRGGCRISVLILCCAQDNRIARLCQFDDGSNVGHAAGVIFFSVCRPHFLACAHYLRRQVLKNNQRKSVAGVSPILIGSWFLGDAFKTGLVKSIGFRWFIAVLVDIFWPTVHQVNLFYVDAFKWDQNDCQMFVLL